MANIEYLNKSNNEIIHLIEFNIPFIVLFDSASVMRHMYL